MKKLLWIVVFLLSAGVAWGDPGNLVHHGDFEGSFATMTTEILIPNNIVFGANLIEINLTTGEVTLSPELTLSEASVEFWQMVQESFGGEAMIKALAKSGALCRVYGHRWYDTTPQIVYTSNPPQYPARRRVCEFCGVEQVRRQTPSVWEDVTP